MSTRVMSQCWPLAMPPTAKAVLISLADNANDHGYCWPSISKIAERTCFGRTAIIDAIAWLEEAGLVTADRTNGRHTTYVITPENLRVGPVKNQSARRTGSPDGPVRQTVDQSARRTAPVREADTNRQEPSVRATVKDLDFSTWPSRPSPQALADWLDHRKRKKAPVSATVLKAAGKEITIAVAEGMTVDECLEVWMLRNWQGFKAEWALQQSDRGQGQYAQSKSKQMQALNNLQDMRNGLASGRGNGGFPAFGLLGHGSSASGRSDPGDGDGLV